MIEILAEAYQAALQEVSTNIAQFSANPGVDFTRNRKLGIETVLNYLVTNGGESSKNELLDLCADMEDPPSAQAMVKQRAKLLPSGVQQLLYAFNHRVDTLIAAAEQECDDSRKTSDVRNDEDILSEMHWVAVDGTTFIFSSDHRYAGDEYYSQSGPDQRGTYSMFLTALYDLTSRRYTDGIIQPLRQMNERSALCEFVDSRTAAQSASNTVIIADRGYESYNVLAHMIENQRYFVIRFPDTASGGGILHHLGLPQDGVWDKEVDLELTRSKSKKIVPKAPFFRVLEVGSTFDYLPRKSQETYRMKFRVVRLDIDGNGTYECLVTNLPAQEYPLSVMGRVYQLRWGIETSFRELKYTIGALHFHAARPQLVEQEIWAALVAYNVTELMAQAAAALKPRNMAEHFVYRANFSRCAHIVKQLLRHNSNYTWKSALRSMQRDMVAVRPNRHFGRNMEKRQRRRSYFTYRAA